jgi:hypothetical protein
LAELSSSSSRSPELEARGPRVGSEGAVCLERWQCLQPVLEGVRCLFWLFIPTSPAPHFCQESLVAFPWITEREVRWFAMVRGGRVGDDDDDRGCLVVCRWMSTTIKTT